MKTSLKIQSFLRQNGSASGSRLTAYLDLSDRAVRKQLKSMLDNGQVTKTGRPPQVFYSLTLQKTENDAKTDNFDENANFDLIQANYLYITPQGVVQTGWDGFIYWCTEHKMDVSKTAGRYRLAYEENGRRKREGLVDTMYKLKMTFDDVSLDKAFCIDHQSIDLFGKTKLAHLVTAAKQSQDKHMADEIAMMIKPDIMRLIEKYQIDAVGFIPPTLKRQTQLMVRLQETLALEASVLTIAKQQTPVVVPQSNLATAGYKAANAWATINVAGSSSYNNILLIDDYMGSGASLNETAKQIRDKGLCRGRMIAVAITGDPDPKPDYLLL